MSTNFSTGSLRSLRAFAGAGFSALAAATLPAAGAAALCGPAPLTDSSAMLALSLLTAAVFFEGMFASVGPGRPTDHQFGAATALNIIHGASVCLVFCVSLAWAGSMPSLATAAIGSVGMAVGAGLRAWSIVTLAGNFGSGFRMGRHERCSAGPYRFLRHPAEMGLLLIVVGFVTTAGAWHSHVIAAIPLVVACSFFRITAEEKAMRRQA